MRDCVRELAVANGEREILLSTSGATQGVWDPARLAQLTSNLLGNALKYGRPDQPVAVFVDGTADDEVGLRVHNFGNAIDPEFLSDIFEPLVRDRNARGPAQGGGADLGLGLYIAREVVVAHGGTIRVTSDAVSGTAFDVRLPRSVPDLAS